MTEAQLRRLLLAINRCTGGVSIQPMPYEFEQRLRTAIHQMIDQRIERQQKWERIQRKGRR